MLVFIKEANAAINRFCIDLTCNKKFMKLNQFKNILIAGKKANSKGIFRGKSKHVVNVMRGKDN
jgi:hypothetical protein